MTIDDIFKKATKAVVAYHRKNMEKKHPGEFLAISHDRISPNEKHPDADYSVNVKPIGMFSVKCFGGIGSYNRFVYNGKFSSDGIMRKTYKKNEETGDFESFA